MKSIFFAVCLLTMLIACNSSSGINNGKKSTDNKQVIAKEEGDNLITFKLNGAPVRTSAWTI
ncbi:MAG: hypothetical protein H7Y31_06975, partial [Chitinophagaceae bacterium]|nr:hypothetical protein [Chitinophagaceae bacterium]